MSKYSGEIIVQEEKGREAFDWLSLTTWVASLVVSLIPTGLSILLHITNGKSVDLAFWQSCIKDNDVMWIFATVLLFSVMNSVIRKRREALNPPLIIGLVLFAIIEGLWAILKYKINTTPETTWLVYLCACLIAAAMILATPLQIDFKRKNH